MDEHDHLVTVASVSESTVTPSMPTADETLTEQLSSVSESTATPSVPTADETQTEQLSSVSEYVASPSVPTTDETLTEQLGCEGQAEGTFCAGEVEVDGGEIMVEVVRHDVFVDGVGGHAGGGDLNREGGGDQLGEEGLGREMETIDGEGGVIHDLALQEVGDLGDQQCDARNENGEHDHVVTVASVSESTVTPSVPTADETLAEQLSSVSESTATHSVPTADETLTEQLSSVSESVVTPSVPTTDETLTEQLGCEGQAEGSFCAGEVDVDGGEIMVEVVRHDVFVDGVGGHADGGDLNHEGGADQLGEEGLGREMETIDGEGGVIHDLALQEVGDLGDQLCDARNENGEHDHVVTVASVSESTTTTSVPTADETLAEQLSSVSESTATPSVPTADETLKEQLSSVSESVATPSVPTTDEMLTEQFGCEGQAQGTFCAGEVEVVGEEIMVEVVHHDVFVDGVGGHAGGGDLNREGGGDQLGEEGLGREMKTIDGEGGVIHDLALQEVGDLGDQQCDERNENGVHSFQEIAGSSGERTCDVAEEVELMVIEEGLEKSKELNRRADAICVSTSDGACGLDGEARSSGTETGVGASLSIAGSSSGKTQVVAEKVMVVVSEKVMGRGLAEEGVERPMESVDVAGGDHLTSQPVDVLDDELCNLGIKDRQLCSSLTAESLTTQTQVVPEGVNVMIIEENLNCKDEVPVEVNLPCPEEDQSAPIEMVNVETDSGAVSANAELLRQHAEVSVGGEVDVMNEEETLHAVVDVKETNVFDGNLHCLVEDQQMQIKTTGESSESRGNLGVDSISFPEPSKVVTGGEVAAMDDKVSSNSNVEAPLDVGLSGIGGDVGEVSMACVDSGSSIEETDVAARYLVAIDSKVSVSDSAANTFGGGEALTKENRGGFDENVDCVEDQELKVDTVGGSSKSDVAVCTELDSSSEQTQNFNDTEVTLMDSKVPNPEMEVPTTDIIYSMLASSEDLQNVKFENSCGNAGEDKDCVEDQELKFETGGGSSKSDVAVCAEPESSSEQTQVVNDREVTVMDNKVANPEMEVQTTDMMDTMLASSEDFQNVKCEKSCGNAGEDGVVPADLESSYEQVCIAERGEVTGMDIEEVLDGKDQNLKVDGRSENDVSQGHMESSDEPNQIAHIGDIAAMDNEEVPKFDFEAEMKDGGTVLDVLELDTSNGTLCLSEIDEDLKVSMSGCTGKEDFVQADSGTLVEHILVERGETPVMDDKNGSNSQIEFLDGKTGFPKDENLDTLTVGGSKSSGEQIRSESVVESLAIEFQGTVEVRPCVSLDGNISVTVKDEDLKVESVGRGMVEDGDVGKDPSLGAEVHDTSVTGTNSATVEENKDEKQEVVVQQAETLTHVVDCDDCMNPSIADEISNEGPCSMALSHTVAEVTAFHNEGDPVPSFVKDYPSPLPDGNQTSKIHVVSNDISLLDGDQSMGTCASDVVTSNEMVNQAIEVQGESCKAGDNHIVCAHDLEAKDSKLIDSESIMGNLVVDTGTCLNEEGKWKSQNGDVIEDDGSAQGMEGNARLQFSECIDGSAAGDCTGPPLNVGLEVEVEEQCTEGGEQVDLHREQETEVKEQTTEIEQSLSIDEKIPEQMTLKPGCSVTVHQSCYLLPPENEGEFSVSDLVWGKVKFHPWWPGQIFDPADASEKAMKYHKKECFLVAYFGDQTFAWNDASLLKPFRTHFSQIEKQSNSEAFHFAVSCALEEVSRRIELGLACSCIPKDTYDMIESQIIENTGIRPDSSRRYGVDKSTGVSSFEPDKLVENIRALAQSPSGGGDRLELTIAKAQLLAFFRFKGYSQLPEFQLCGGLLENNADTSQLSEAIEHATSASNDSEQMISSEGMLKGGNISSHKRKHNLTDGAYPRKKERSLSELMDDAMYSSDGEEEADGKVTTKSVSSSAGRKRKAVDSVTDVSDRRINFYAAKVSTTASPISKPSFKVGECIRRVASQMTGSPSLLKCSSEKFLKVDGNVEQPVGFDFALQTPESSKGGKMIVPTEHLDEMLMQLHLTARDPMKGYSFLNTIITFFSSFRHSIALGQYSRKQNSSTGRLGVGRKKKASHAIMSAPEEFEFDESNDSYWTDRIVQNNGEEPLLHNSQNGEGDMVAFDPDKPLKSRRRSYSRKRFFSGNHEMEAEESTEHIEGSKQDMSPTELILNFAVGDCIPSEMNLNKMFRRFGTLKESETEVDRLTSRARVVFKRGSDAEVAFSSAANFNIFGPMLVTYELSYSPSISFKTMPVATQ